MENDVETTFPEAVEDADASAQQAAKAADANTESTAQGTEEPVADSEATPASNDVESLAQTQSAAEDVDASTKGDEQAPVKSRRSASSSKEDLEREGEVAADFLETLMDIADLDGDLEVDVDGDRAAVSIVDSEEGSAPRRLVGTKANVLEALQELTRLAVQAETGERSRLMLDVAGYRSNRRAELVETTAGVIKAVRGGEPRHEMEPMSAFERKVVHDEVLRSGLRSESEGEEPRRFVVVLPA